MRRVALWLVALALTLGGCDADDDADPRPDGAAPDAVGPASDATPADGSPPPIDAAPEPGDAAPPYDGPTWHGAVRAIFEQRCVECHQAGGVAPFDLRHRDADWTDGPPPWVRPAAIALETGRMPPWPPDPACRPLRHARLVPDAEREAVRIWAEAGFPAGDPAAYVQPPAPADPIDDTPPDLIVQPAEGYLPDSTVPDDYRCLPVSHTFERDTWVTRTRAIPDRADLVHHIVVFLIPPTGSDAVDRRDDQTDIPGYRCFGDPVVYPASVFALWAPGASDEPLPDGGALLVPAGARLVMQMHYNMANGLGDPRPDRSRLELWTLPEGEQPEARIDVVGFADLWLDIPAGEGAHTGGQDFQPTGAGELVAVAPHMHLLGQRIRADLVRADGSEECVVDIPDWDFQWQAGYFFPEGEAPSIGAGDTLRLRCTYDNSAAGQPTGRAPDDVGWGDGTFDEMCLLFGYIRRPLEAPYDACEGARDCMLGCSADDATCVFQCLNAGGIDCLICGANEWIECAFDQGCAGEVARLVACIGGTSPCGGGACVVDSCIEQSDTVWQCSRDAVTTGACNGRLRQCGLRFPRAQ